MVFSTPNVYRRYLLAVLLTILAFNSVDGYALGLVLQNIKTDLHLSDTQLGVLTGIAFALFYSVMGIPIARWADRGNRVLIISITTALWSAAVALCGIAGNFMQLLGIRIAVGFGEAGCIPPAHSLIADTFTRGERPRAVAIYMLGASISPLIGFFFAGWLAERYGWRVMFFVLSLPSLALAALAWVTLREPRVGTSRSYRAEAAPPDLTRVCVVLWRNITFRHLMFYFFVGSFFNYGILQWQPAFLSRTYGVSVGELGIWLAVVFGAGGLLGTYLGGQLAARFWANNERLQLKSAAFAYCSLGVFSAAIYLSPNRYLSLAFMTLATIGGAAVNGPLFATIQTLVPACMRATSIALIYFFANLIGVGLGPLSVGALSDWFRPALGEESLRYALLAMCPGYLWGSWYLWKASRTVTRDLDRRQEDHERGPEPTFMARRGEAAALGDIP